MQFTQPWKGGHIHSVIEPDGELHVACIDTRFKDFPTIRQAKLWLSMKSAKPKRIDWVSIKPEASDSNPVLDFYDAAHRLVYSSTAYQTLGHAWAHIKPNYRPKIVDIKRRQP